mmetsp:Transcript_10549/g.28851  ORF Transcript_10549/g.28851 Transcript_10549/m.28851 type:complete len:220 (+) Transcript_10549:5238-5897(+)
MTGSSRNNPASSPLGTLTNMLPVLSYSTLEWRVSWCLPLLLLALPPTPIPLLRLLLLTSSSINPFLQHSKSNASTLCSCSTRRSSSEGSWSGCVRMCRKVTQRLTPSVRAKCGTKYGATLPPPNLLLSFPFPFFCLLMFCFSFHRCVNLCALSSGSRSTSGKSVMLGNRPLRGATAALASSNLFFGAKCARMLPSSGAECLLRCATGKKERVLACVGAV